MKNDKQPPTWLRSDRPDDTPLRTCGSCHRQLPPTDFYTNRRTGRIDSYCRECRRKQSRLQRKCCADSSAVPVSSAAPADTPVDPLADIPVDTLVDTPPDYPVITQLPPGEERHRLLHHAMQEVARRILSRRRNRWKEM